jgi:hypothetical protein
MRNAVAAQSTQFGLPGRTELDDPPYLIAILFRGVGSDPAIDETAAAYEFADGSPVRLALWVFYSRLTVLNRAFLNP